MLATVLRGELAEKQSIFIMRAFREMRHYIKQNQQFVTETEMELLNARMSEIAVRMVGMSDRQKKVESDIQKNIDIINENFISDKEYKNFVIYKGQKFEADVAYIDIYQQAVKSIYVVDDYMNIKTLQLLSQKKHSVEVILFTQNGQGRKGFLMSAVVDDFAEQVYHCGASSKDAGKKLCAINKVENTEMVHPMVDKMLEGNDLII